MIFTQLLVSLSLFLTVDYHPLAEAFPLLQPGAAKINGHTRSTTIHMVKFDGEKWIAQKPEETSEFDYPLVNTLLLHGPKPFVTRIFQPDEYEQAILKFMAGDKCDRITAQGNMDAYLQNPNDWAFNRMEEQKRGVKYDYVTLQPKQVVLVVVWSAVVFGVVGRAVYSISNGVGFVRCITRGCMAHFCLFLTLDSFLGSMTFFKSDVLRKRWITPHRV